jgi:glutathione synthase/RimK-type ligase-like ATP-grasp enzyme
MKDTIIVSRDLDLVSNHFNCVIGQYCSHASLAFAYESQLDSGLINILKAKGVPVIGGARLNKIAQSILMDRLSINHPKTFFTNQLQPINSIDLLNAYVDLDEFVVKPINGARGIAVKKISRKDFKKCLINKNEVSCVFADERKFLKEEQNSDYRHVRVEDYITSMIIQEPIDVSREFRLILFKSGNKLIYERERKDGQFCANLSHGSTPKTVDDEFYNQHFSKIEKSFLKVMDDFEYPFLSIDLYLDKNNVAGCFEFQMEFAYEGFDHTLVRKNMIESIKYFIKKYEPF